MDDSLAAPILPLAGCQGLEQFLLLAKTARGPAAVELVKQALEAPGVYVFGELLETDCVKELSEGSDVNYARLLEVFAYGTYGDYRSTKILLQPKLS
jgi:COP9 signalosome complex subunit 7